MRADSDEEGSAPVDPFADLLFMLIAAVLPAILVLLPAMHLSAAAPAREDASEPLPAPIRAEVKVGGERAWPIVAQADGLRLTGLDNHVVPLDSVPDDAILRDALDRLRVNGEPLLLIVEPDGLESAFLLEPVAAAHGPREMQQVRATQPCAAARDPALAQACTAGSEMPARGKRP